MSQDRPEYAREEDSLPAGLIVHEWVEARGGAEKVLIAMATAAPHADVKVLWSEVGPQLRGVHMEESWIARTRLRRHKVAALPFMALTWRFTQEERAHEWVLVSSHLFAHHHRTKRAPKLVYAHTPARYIWEPDMDARGGGLLARAASTVLRPLDRYRAREARSIAANSGFVADRIRRTWRRDARVIYPPVAVESLQSSAPWSRRLNETDQQLLGSLPEGFLLGISRFVQYKKLDRVIAMGEELEVPVVIAGSGPELQRLRALAEAARVEVRIVVAPSDELLYSLYEAAQAVFFPPIEDFGIVPVEAMALGTPVLVALEGGARESVAHCEGGVAVDPDNPQGWFEAWEQLREIDTAAMAERARFFDESRFQDEITQWIRDELNKGEGR